MIPGPLPAARRIAAIDVLRGLALLGIVVVNSAYFGLPLTESLASKQGEGPMLDQIAGMLVSVFAEFKFISIFSILFGFGLAMQRARRLESTGRFAGFGCSPHGGTGPLRTGARLRILVRRHPVHLRPGRVRRDPVAPPCPPTWRG